MEDFPAADAPWQADVSQIPGGPWCPVLPTLPDSPGSPGSPGDPSRPSLTIPGTPGSPVDSIEVISQRLSTAVLLTVFIRNVCINKPACPEPGTLK